MVYVKESKKGSNEKPGEENYKKAMTTSKKELVVCLCL